MDVHQTTVKVVLPAKSNAETPANAASEGRADTTLDRFRGRPATLLALSECGFPSVRYLDPLRVRRGPGFVAVMPLPPLVWLRLWVALRRVLPFFLAPKRCDIEIVPCVPHLLVATVVDEVGAKDAVAVADEGVRAVPLVHAEVEIEAVRDAVPRHLPLHSRLEPIDILLRRARDERKRRVACVQMSDMGDLVGYQRATRAGMVRPAVHTGLEKGPIDDQLTTAVEQVEQTHLSLRSVERVRLLHGQPRHPPALGGHRVPGVGQLLLFHEEPLARGLPLLRRDDRRCVHWKTLCPRRLVRFLVHIASSFFLFLRVSTRVVRSH